MPNIDAEIGGTASNSYITLANANLYYADTLIEDRWLSYSSDDREKALIQATKQSERHNFKGTKMYNTITTEQALWFPRTGDYDTVDGTTVIILQDIEDYVCIQALYLLDKNANPDMIDRQQLQHEGLSGISIDGFSESWMFHGADNFSAEAKSLLVKYIKRLGHIKPRGRL